MANKVVTNREALFLIGFCAACAGWNCSPNLCNAWVRNHIMVFLLVGIKKVMSRLDHGFVQHVGERLP